MEQFFLFLSGNPLLLSVVLVAAVLAVFSFFRRALQLLVVAVAAGLLYAAWLQLSGGDAPEFFRQAKDTVSLSLVRLGAMLKELFGLLKFLK